LRATAVRARQSGGLPRAWSMFGEDATELPPDLDELLDGTRRRNTDPGVPARIVAGLILDFQFVQRHRRQAVAQGHEFGL